MVCRKIIDLPHTAVRARLGPIKARPHTFVKFTWHGNRHSTGLQGTLTRAMASICVHRAPRTPPDSTPRHIRSRDDLQEDHRPATDLPYTAVRARLVPGPTLSCKSPDKAIAFLRACRAHPLARWHQFVSIARRKPLQTALQGTLTRAMVCRKITDLPRTAVQAPHPPFLQIT